MLRSFLIYLSKSAWMRNLVMNWKPAWKVASRFVAGKTLEDALQAVKKLNDRGINATLDHLGEHTSNIEEARRATEDVLAIFDSIQASRVRANVSIKLTQLGLRLGEEECIENVARILKRAQEAGTFLRIDMEDSPWVDATLDVYQKMRSEYGFNNVGVVIQSCLYRSEADIQRLSENCTPVRLCKGAYKEPADVAYPKKQDVDASYDRLAQALMDNAKQRGCPEVSADGKTPPPPALATHDEQRVQAAIAYAKKIGLPKKALEFQMLHGIRRDLQERLAEEGYPVRIYVPYGAEWYPYFTRRLAERPANLWFFVSNFFRG
ncbi:MAG: proline dehydrogenase family protein [Chloroflexi bacterium]|nr:proline dehydrogenase family protein [Chloroflexota bacterium]